MRHKPVLLREVLKYLDPKPGEDFIDATVGDGGHAQAILEHTGPDGCLLGIDLDPSTALRAGLESPSLLTEGPRCDTGSMVREPEPPRTALLNQRDRSGIAPRSLERASLRRFDLLKGLNPNGRFVVKQGNFADIAEIARATGFKQVSGVLFDLGLRSGQIDEAGYGFSYRVEGPLDMRFDRTNKADDTDDLTAVDIVNEWSESELARIFREYGEERNAKKIARAIASARVSRRIEITAELVRILGGSTSPKTLARVFQALRIAVNNELENLQSGLAGAWSVLWPGGRLAVISYHSLEDRIVKHFFRDKLKVGEGKILTPKPVCPSQNEIRENPRARSAKLRAVTKIPSAQIPMSNK